MAGSNSVQHSRVRPLNVHRHCYDVNNDDVIPLCNMILDNTFYLFLKYPTLASQRVTLINRVTDILNTANSLDTDPSLRNSTELHSLLLCGSTRLTIEVNTRRYCAVHCSN